MVTARPILRSPCQARCRRSLRPISCSDDLPRARVDHAWSSTLPRLSAFVEITKPVEALLQGLGAFSEFCEHLRSRCPSAPSEMRLGLGRPTGALKPTAKLRIGLRLHHGNARVDFTARALAFDICPGVSPVILILFGSKLELHRLRPSRCRRG